jgi:PTH1 family peptidyl-tRNA hydrolase
MVLERLADELRADPFRDKWGAELSMTSHRGVRLALVRSKDFMNHSGRAIAKVRSFYDVPVQRLIAIHDDLDLPFGAVRVKAGGGHGGHNGLRSLDQSLGSNDYLRVRVGIGRPGGEHRPPDRGGASARRERKQGAVVGHVLGDFSVGERAELAATLQAAGDAALCLVVDGTTLAMNRFNGTRPAERAKGSHN